MYCVNSWIAIMLMSSLLFQELVAALNCTEPTPESLFHAFERELFPKRFIRPVKTFRSSTNVTLKVTLVAILGVNEKEQTLSMLMWQTLEWDVEGLSWDQNECGVSRVSVPRDMLWFPDVIITEILDGETPDTPFVYLDNKGHVYDDRTRRVVTSCQLTIFYFPFDIQNCSLTFGSFLHTASDIKISAGLTSEEILQGSREVMYTVGEWKLADIRHAQNVLEFEGSRYSELKYYVILQRRPILYVVNLLVPSIFMVTVDLLSFLLPPQSVDRSSFKMTLILGYTVFLLIMNDLLPVTGNAIPLINVFFSISLALMVASLLETVLITNIQSNGQYRAVPRWLRVLLLQYGATLVCLPRQAEVNKVTVLLPQQTGDGGAYGINNDCVHLSAKDLQLSSHKDPPGSVQDSTFRELFRDVSAIRRQVDAHTRGIDVNKEWHLLGLVLDRLLFGLYILFITVSFITIACIWTVNSEN